jgi:hypothetical protein
MLYGCAAATAALAVRRAIVTKAMALMRMIEADCLINGGQYAPCGFRPFVVRILNLAPPEDAIVSTIGS